MVLKLPEQSEFRAWLEDRRGEVVGQANQSFRCPIANHIRETQGFDEVSVSFVTGIQAGVDRIPAPSWPEWLEHFVISVDDGSTPDDPECDGVWCLSLLDNYEI